MQQPKQQQQQARRSRARSSNSLVALLLALQGGKVSLELRNDVMISGQLASVDEYMNMFLDDAVWQPLQGPAVMYPVLFVRGRNLRMVHLPRDLDAAAVMDKHVAQLKKQRVAAALDMINKRHERLAKGADALDQTGAGGEQQQQHQQPEGNGAESASAGSSAAAAAAAAGED